MTLLERLCELSGPVLRIRPMLADDVEQLRLTPHQAALLGPMQTRLTADYGATLVAAGPAWTGVDADGQVVGCAGFSVVHDGCADAWALLGDDLRRVHVAMTRAVHAAFALAPWRRIQALVRPDCPAAARWAMLCGLQRCARLRAMGLDGSDFDLFERIAPAPGICGEGKI